ncbi:MAG TPA: hypothetical protein VIM55_09035, partial [Mucilaginibacter sp.]
IARQYLTAVLRTYGTIEEAYLFSTNINPDGVVFLSATGILLYVPLLPFAPSPVSNFITLTTG